MHFVDWCGHVLARLVAFADESDHATLYGMQGVEASQAVFGYDLAFSPGFDETPESEALTYAICALASVHLVITDGMHANIKLTDLARTVNNDPTALWLGICSIPLDDSALSLLRVVNRLSMKESDAYANIERVERIPTLELLDQVPNIESVSSMEVAAKRLRDNKLAHCGSRGGSGGKDWNVEATYAGLVRETKGPITHDTRLIDQLRATGETFNVDFKREVHTYTKEQIGDFMKDILALANTSITGSSRWLIIGFERTTYDYWAAPDTKLTPEHIEDLVAEYTDPAVPVKYDLVPHPEGLVGKLEVLPDACSLPYRAKQTITDSRRRKVIAKNQIYIRRNSHNAVASPRERAALRDQRDRARALRAMNTTP